MRERKSVQMVLVTCRVHTGQGNLINFTVREFYVMSGKNECFLKCQGILRFPVCIK